MVYNEGYVEIISSENLDTVTSFLFNPLDKTPSKLDLVDVSFHKIKNRSFLGLMISSVSVIFFNEQEVIEEFYVEKNEKIIDFYVDEEEINKKGKSNTVTVQLLMRKEVSENNFTVFYQIYSFVLGGANSGVELTSETQLTTSNLSTTDNCYLTKNNIVFFSQTTVKHYSKNNLVGDVIENLINSINYTYEVSKNDDTLLILPFNSSKVYLYDLSKNIKKEHDLILNNSFLLSKKDNKNNQLYYIVQKNTDSEEDTIRVSLLDISNSNNSKKEIKSEILKIEKNCKITNFSALFNKILLVCNYDQLFFFEIGKKSPLWSVKNSLSNPSFSKLLNIDRSEFFDSTNEKEKKTISISSILNSVNSNKEINSIAFNVVNNILNTFKYLIDGVTNFLNKFNSNVTTERSVLSKQITFLVLQKNNKLIIYDITSDTHKLDM